MRKLRCRRMTYRGPDASKSKLGFGSRWPDPQVHTLHCPHHRPASPVLWSVMRTVRWNSGKTLLSLAFLLSSVIACPAGISASGILSLVNLLDMGTPARLCRMMATHVQINLCPEVWIWWETEEKTWAPCQFHPVESLLWGFLTAVRLLGGKVVSVLALVVA